MQPWLKWAKCAKNRLLPSFLRQFNTASFFKQQKTDTDAVAVAAAARKIYFLPEICIRGKNFIRHPSGNSSVVETGE